MFIITQETAEAYKKAESETQLPQTINPETITDISATTINIVRDVSTSYVTSTTTEPTEIITPPAEAQVPKWTGPITPQKWMNFYTRVLSKFAANKDLKLTLKVVPTRVINLFHQFRKIRGTA
ncbi:MAG: hypothetical protein KME60_24825 [Cyanomargarita calcarea GSE-NOS-MK-12-04C]|uniref:Uncharacterized protein n=1 Tax=Cyanomargarita calcarea GSE-NOS-MK-12-04C TaxID=2839659 RepID=A0A951QQF1_9CYAN|nr:hypothetical protein [Cyanomargarita calcarea GSE-NOS-MK-12-04C]